LRKIDAMQSIKKEIIDWAKASKPNNAQQLKELFDKATFTQANFDRMRQLIDTIITSINAVMPFTQEELS
jgi:signal transduction histidine kinase